jgi:ketosteroid isomerase-like protein
MRAADQVRAALVTRRYDLRMDHERQIRDIWDARSRGDLEPLRGALTPDAKWRAVEDGPWNCENAAAIIDVMASQLADGFSGQIEDVFEVGERTVVAFRPDRHEPGEWPLDHGIRYLVVSFAGERLTELKGCADRAAALAYAESV